MPASVIVVEDSPVMRERIVRMLESLQDVDVVGSADDAASAIALIDSRRPQIVVLDVQLSHDDLGIDVLHHARSVAEEPLVVVLSNFDWASLRIRYLAAGAHAYFDKSLEFEQARDCIARLAAAPPRAS